jgi:uncharacterized protein (TIGR02118 family)
MIKVMTFVRRRPGLTREEFLAYWLNHHAPLVMSVEGFWRHVRKYRQNHALDAEQVFGAAGFDGCAELWFDDVEGLRQAIADPGYTNIIRPDELRCFDDLSGFPVIMAVEHDIHS